MLSPLSLTPMVSACLAYDAQAIHEALIQGASATRADELGRTPLAMIIDPGRCNEDMRQAQCLKVLLDWEGEALFGRETLGSYTSTFHRIAFFLPSCAKVVLDFYKGMPPYALDLDDPAHKQWWIDFERQWRSEKEGMELNRDTASVSPNGALRRL